jgi:hypothetical protein
LEDGWEDGLEFGLGRGVADSIWKSSGKTEGSAGPHREAESLRPRMMYSGSCGNCRAGKPPVGAKAEPRTVVTLKPSW